MMVHDPVNHPSHYTSHPSGVECITITRHMNFLLGNALKYIWRAGLKGDAIQDLEKAAFYLNEEINLRKVALATRPDHALPASIIHAASRTPPHAPEGEE